MGDKTGIEWCDATWNPVTGCAKVSQGCKHCYAETVADRFWPTQYKTENGQPRKFTDVWTHPDRLDQPLRWTRPRRIFVNSMSDLFHEDVPTDFITEVFAVMALAPRHTFQVLTKRPERMLEWMRPVGQVYRADFVRSRMARILDTTGPKMPPYVWPLPNVWMGVSVEDQKTADERVPLLLQASAAIKFVSYEPALGPVNFIPKSPPAYRAWLEPGRGIDWVIAGGESGPGARAPHPSWFTSVRDQCAKTGVAYLFKQWGEWAPDTDLDECCHADKIRRHDLPEGEGANAMLRVGKKIAGRELEGKIHDGYPKVIA